MTPSHIRDELLAQHEAIRTRLDAVSFAVRRWADGAESQDRVRDEVAALADALRSHNLREEAALRRLLQAHDDGSGHFEIVRIGHVREHQDLFEAILAMTETNDPHQGALALDRLRTRLLEHMKKEEESFLEPSATPNREGTESPRQALARNRRMDLGAVVARVQLEHHVIRRLLDELERASSSARGGGQEGLPRLHGAVWELYLAFQDHLLYEERDLAPFLASVGEAWVRKMILEHNEERSVLLTLVEDSESDALGAEALAAQADDLVARFRSDMLHEEGVLSGLVRKSI